ncbi:multicopper oxidase family protein, partial [Christiangramia crocea]
MKRRKFVINVSMGVAALELGLLASCATDTLEEELLDYSLSARKGKPPKVSPRNPLKIPNLFSGNQLKAATHNADIGGGKSSSVWAFNDSFPGPTIEVSRGGNFQTSFVNNLQDESIVHWHGMLVNHQNDGHPKFAVAPGNKYDYNFTVNQRATLNWYHPHPHGKTGEQVNMGLAGAFIIRDEEEQAKQLPAGDYEIPLIIRDATFNRAGDIEYKPRSGGFAGKTFLVNGTTDPFIEVDRAVYRLRLLNGSNARIFSFNLSNNDPFRLIGNDGGFLENEVSINNIVASPAERMDLLVDFRNVAAGESVMLRDEFSGWELLEFKVGNKLVNSDVPFVISSISKLENPVRQRNFSFDGMSKINGQLYEMDRIDWEVPFNETEEWIFTTNGNAPHPVHIHGAYFQVQSREGGRNQLFPWENGWKDTVLLEDGETVRVRIKFDTPETQGGTYLMHCHKLEHEDMGMMANFKVL